MERRINSPFRQVKRPSASSMQLLNDSIPVRRLRFHRGQDKKVEVTLQELTMHT